MILNSLNKYTFHLSKEEFLAIADFFSDEVGTLLLLSGGSFDSASSSFLGLFPIKSVLLNGKHLKKIEGCQTSIFDDVDPWDSLNKHFFQPFHLTVEKTAIGWFGYGMAAFAIDNPSLYKPSSFPDAYWQLSAITLIFDEKTGRTECLIDQSCLSGLSDFQRKWVNLLNNAEGWLSLKEKKHPFEKEKNKVDIISKGNKEEYIEKVHEIQELIREGEVYQVNLAQHFTFQSQTRPFTLFKSIFLKNPSPFSSFMHIDEGTILSISPERFLSKKENILETRPIKGTAPRDRNAEEDKANLESLLASEKECAELLMITDLMRNDLGKISRPGSVSVLELRRVEAYTNVLHLLSIIQSESKNVSSLEIVRSCFPAGSITGCPKERAMHVINDLEPEGRGIYTGSIGYFKSNGDFDLNVAIRTAVYNGSFYDLQLGSGIVIDSNPEKEFEETLHKGASFF